MSFDFRFRSLQDESEVFNLENFLRLQSLGYPNYQDWVTRAREEMLKGHKKGILALSGGKIVGDSIFQQHKEFPKVIELKNLRIDKRVRNRYFGSFLFRQVEVESKKQGYRVLMCDARSNDIESNSLLRFCGCQELIRAPLYGGNIEDIIYYKALEKGDVLNLINLN